jgi:alkyl hydroperoxide reductase subunit AhpC
MVQTTDSNVPTLRIGAIAPDFKAETTKGKIESFHEFKKDSWAVLFSHPADFTPVCMFFLLLSQVQPNSDRLQS